MALETFKKTLKYLKEVKINSKNFIKVIFPVTNLASASNEEKREIYFCFKSS